MGAEIRNRIASRQVERIEQRFVREDVRSQAEKSYFYAGRDTATGRHMAKTANGSIVYASGANFISNGAPRLNQRVAVEPAAGVSSVIMKGMVR